MQLSRPTVVQGFRELEREGWIVSHVGRGSFVAERAGEALAGELRPTVRMPAGPSADHEALQKLFQLRLSHMASFDSLARPRPGAKIVDLRSGSPALPGLGKELLADLARRAVDRFGLALGQYSFQGLPELKTAMAARLTAGGCKLSADQLLVTHGAQDAITFLGIWATHTSRRVFCESPTFWGVPHALSFCGHFVRNVYWHDRADALDELEREAARGPMLLYACADFQNPTGLCLDAATRRRIAKIARMHDMVVAVDDINRDLRFTGEQETSLYEMLPENRRILVTSLSKSVMPGLRVGFMAADPGLLTEISEIKRYTDLGGPPLMQAIAADFLENEYDAHLARVRDHYRLRCEAVCETLSEHLPRDGRFVRPDGGFHMWVELPPGTSSMELYRLALEKNIAISPGPLHDLDGRFGNCLRVSYAQASPNQITSAVEQLCKLIPHATSTDRPAHAAGSSV